MTFKQFRDVLQDVNGNAIADAPVIVYTPQDVLASIYADEVGTGGPINNSTVFSDDAGEYSFYADDGIYKLVITASGFAPATINGVVVGSGRKNEYVNAIGLASSVGLAHNDVVTALGSGASTDGGGGRFTYKSSGSYTPDGGIVIAAVGGGYFVREGYSSDGFLYPIRPEWFYSLGTDDTVILQAALTTASLLGCKVELQPRTYECTQLTKYNNVDLEGSGAGVTTLKQTAGTVGRFIIDYPQVGTSTPAGGKAAYRRLRIDGNNTGITKFSGTLTATSNVITAVTDTTGMENGFFIEGEGIPADTTIVSFDPGASTVTMSAAATYTKAGTKCIWREARSATATATATLTTLTVPALSTSGIVVGMRASGANLDTDGEDLSQNSWVVGVDPGTNTVTLDRPASVSGAFTLTCYVYNTALYVAEPYYNPAFDEDKEYRAPTLESVQISNGGGDGYIARPGRDQTHLAQDTKVVLCYGTCVVLQGTNDSQIDAKVGMGNGWRGNLKISSCSTPRVIGCDIYDGQQSDKYYDVIIRGCRQAYIGACDINGRVLVNGNSGETSHGVRLSGINWKWHSNSLLPDGTATAYLTVANGAQVFLEAPYFYGDRVDNGCPNYLFQLDGAGTVLNLAGTRVLTGAETNRPYKVAMYTATNGALLRGEYIDGTSGLRVSLGDVVGVTDGVQAVASTIGEALSLKVNSGSAVALTTATITNVGNLVASAGDWDQSCVVHFTCTGATLTKLEVGMPGNVSSIPGTPDQHMTWQGSLTGFTGELSLAIPAFQNNRSSSGTERLNVRATFSAGTVAAYGSSFMRRRR